MLNKEDLRLLLLLLLLASGALKVGLLLDSDARRPV